MYIISGEELEAFLAQHGPFDRVVYTGDGSNDFCPILRLRRSAKKKSVSTHIPLTAFLTAKTWCVVAISAAWKNASTKRVKGRDSRPGYATGLAHGRPKRFTTPSRFNLQGTHGSTVENAHHLYTEATHTHSLTLDCGMKEMHAYTESIFCATRKIRVRYIQHMRLAHTLISGHVWRGGSSDVKRGEE